VAGHNHTAALAPGASYSDSSSISVPTNRPPGNYFLIIQTDSGGTVPESDETNNTTSTPFTLTP
jgi:subtilase family serine protease